MPSGDRSSPTAGQSARKSHEQTAPAKPETEGRGVKSEATMRISVRSKAAAERLIAALWIAFERHQLPSPKIRISSMQSEEVVIEIVFSHKDHAELVAKEMLPIQTNEE
jgi:hypothetical protein